MGSYLYPQRRVDEMNEQEYYERVSQLIKDRSFLLSQGEQDEEEKLGYRFSLIIKHLVSSKRTTKEVVIERMHVVWSRSCRRGAGRFSPVVEEPVVSFRSGSFWSWRRGTSRSDLIVEELVVS
ncbi:hypothetical protein DPMN_165954 [Dreissena polymorpha]|uniref:Uncharacterized protein n=1 Tax=Dreissena polymorpha TaxID=45954 RepID=A0A9D4EWA4_DREPO|nr:hypothetical protein DPMN_165954 [Dreissena polymorpha]